MHVPADGDVRSGVRIRDQTDAAVLRRTRVKFWAYGALTGVLVGAPVVMLVVVSRTTPPIVPSWMALVAAIFLMAAMFCVVRLDRLNTVLGSLPLSAAWPPSPRDRYVGHRVVVCSDDALLLRKGRERHFLFAVGLLLLVALLSQIGWMIWRLASQWSATGVINWMFAFAAVLPMVLLWLLSSKRYVVEFACSGQSDADKPMLLVQQRVLFVWPRYLKIPSSAIKWIEIRELAQKGRMLVLVIHSSTHAPLALGFEPFHERRLANLRLLVSAMRRVLAIDDQTPAEQSHEVEEKLPGHPEVSDAESRQRARVPGE